MTTRSEKTVQQGSGGSAVVAALAAHGVDTVFGIPGTHNLAIYAALPDHGITHITPRHEQGGGYAADGYARVSGRVGVVITTTGPAALNGAAALAQAYSDSIPVLLIAPGMPTGHPSHGNGLLHELRNQRLAFDGCVAESHRVESVSEIPIAVAQAFARLRQGRPRAEYLEVPLDLLDEVAEWMPCEPVAVQPIAADIESVRVAASALASGSRTLIVAGGGASGAADELARIAERLDAAVITSTNGKGVLSEHDARSLGAGPQHRAVASVLTQVDQVLAIGTEFATSDWWEAIPPLPDTVVRIDADPAGILVNLQPSHPLVGDAAATLAALDMALTPALENGAPRDSSWIAPAREAIRAEAREAGADWAGAMQALAEALPEQAIIAADNTMSAYYGALAWLELDRPRSFLFPTGLGTLGYGLPAGIGAKIAEPETAVVVIQGDGGLMFVASELATAAQERLALPVLVFDNGGYGEIRNEMEDRGDPVHSVRLEAPDFVQLAQSLGCHGVRVETHAQITDEVKKALLAHTPTLIHVREESRAARAMR